jgi:hypothetical protein
VVNLISRSSHTHGFKNQIGQDGVDYLVELLGWGRLLFDLHMHWGGVGKGWI